MEYKLRGFRVGDAASIAKCANNHKIAQNLRDVFPYPYTKEDGEAYVRMCMAEDKSRAWTMAVDIDGRAVGSIGAVLQSDVSCKTAELGFWLGEDYWNQGIMTSAAVSFSRLIFETYDIERIYCIVFEQNQASQRMLEKAGFSCEGILRNAVYKNGRIQNAMMYAVLRGEILSDSKNADVC